MKEIRQIRFPNGELPRFFGRFPTSFPERHDDVDFSVVLTDDHWDILHLGDDRRVRHLRGFDEFFLPADTKKLIDAQMKAGVRQPGELRKLVKSLLILRVEISVGQSFETAVTANDSECHRLARLLEKTIVEFRAKDQSG